MLTKEKKSKAIANMQKDKKDTGSAAVQAGILTEQIKERTEHLKNNKHDFMARRGLLQAVGKRKKLLKYVANKDPKAYEALVKKLGIRR